MLLIQNGAETISNQYISSRLHTVLNNFTAVEIDGYTVDFTKTPFEVYDADNVLVYRTESQSLDNVNSLILNEDGSLNEAGYATLQKIIELKGSKYDPEIYTSSHPVPLLENATPQRIKMLFGEIWNDYNVSRSSTAVDEDRNDQWRQETFDKIISLHNSKDSDQPYMIINGSFTAYYIEKFRETLGPENVQVINITRNISSTYLIHHNIEFPQDFIETTVKDGPNNVAGRLFDGSNSLTYASAGAHTRYWIYNLLNLIKVKSLNYVTTYKFEDIISNGKITVNGIDVTFPNLRNYNNYITQKEQRTILPISNLTAANVTATNEYFSTYSGWQSPRAYDVTTPLTSIIVTYNNITYNVANADEKSALNAQINLPSNFFEALDYTPLLFEEIISPKSKKG
jgi:hypothetical protein